MTFNVNAVATIAKVYDGTGIVTVATVNTKAIKTREFNKLLANATDLDGIDTTKAKVVELIHSKVEFMYDEDCGKTVSGILYGAVNAMNAPKGIDYYVE